MKGGFSYLTIMAIGVAALVATPIIFTLYSAINVDAQLWIRLYDTRLKIILPNTIKLLISVGIMTALVGVITAWIVTRYDFKGKRIWEWALILPLAMPGYVLAYAYGSIMALEALPRDCGLISLVKGLHRFWQCLHFMVSGVSLLY